MARKEALCDFTRIERLMKEEDLDVVVASTPANFYYASACYLITQENVPERFAFAVIPRDTKPMVIVNEIEEYLTKEESCIRDVRKYEGAEEGFKREPLSVLVDVLKEAGLQKSRIGVESMYLPAFYYKQLESKLPHASLKNAKSVFARARMVKTQQEIAILKRAAKATDKAVLQAYESARPGDTELKIANAIISNIIQNGGYGAKLTFNCCFTTTNHVHTGPTKSIPREGELVYCDLAARWPCYFSDIGRSAVMGKGQNKRYPAYGKLGKINYDIIESLIRPGVEVREIYKEWLRRIRQAGLPGPSGKLGPHIGHSLGIDVHEYPMINPVNEQILEPGMVMNLEPCFHHEGRFYHVENTMLVTKGGCEILTDEIRADKLFEIT